MTLPRQILPGATYLLTRRCTQRTFWLVPRGPVKRVFGYCLGLTAARHGVQLHGACVLGNHHHAVVSDPHGRISEFARDLHALVARCLNAHFGRWENLWSSQRVSLVRLVDAADIAAKLVYTATNPVAAGLVATATEWPGLRTSPEDVIRRPRVFKRPKKFFRDDGALPETAELRVTVPPAFAHLKPHEFAAHIRAAITERESEIQAQMRRDDRTFIGARAVCKQERTDRPKTTEPRRGLDPAIACKVTPNRIAALQQLVAFRTDYREARRAWFSNHAPVLFPPGTYLMRTYPGVHCARPPDPSWAAA